MKVTKQSILDTAVPVSTRTYKAISHGSIIDAIKENLDKENVHVISERYSGTLGNQIITGHMAVNYQLDNELKFEIAFMNSYNKAKRAVVVSGSEVVVCENGHILGDSSYGVFRRKHTGTADQDIKTFIPEMVKTAIEKFQVLYQQKESMKNRILDKKAINELVGQLYLEESLLKSHQLSLLKKEIELPTFDYNADPNSVWSMYNNVTYVFKQTHPSNWISVHQTLNKTITEKYAI